LALGHYIHDSQLQKVQRNAKNLRPVVVKAEQTQVYRCRGRGQYVCYRTVVSHVVNGETKLSIMLGETMVIGQVATLWLTPSLRHAYASPEAYVRENTPMALPLWLLFAPLFAIIGPLVDMKLAERRNR